MPHGLGTSVTDTSLWRLNYEFGEIDTAGNLNTAKNNGNVARITTTSPVGVYTQSYRYDSLDRLKDAWENSGATQNWTQNFQYDRYGNRIAFQQTKTGQPNYNYTPSVDPNTNRFTTGQGYVYDLSGNLISDNYGRQFFFNGDNKQTEVRNQQNQTVGQYFYDADGKRIKKVTPTETTIFVYSGGKLVMEMTSASTPQTTPQTQYIVNDMLGSIRVLTNQAGQVISRRDFMPFGEDIQRANYGTDNMRQKFTGYQKDNETGLDFAEARMYGNWHGRFTAVDPLLASGKSGNPQTFNRYAYSLNNPTNLTDPSGMQTGKKANAQPEEKEEVISVTSYAFPDFKAYWDYAVENGLKLINSFVGTPQTYDPQDNNSRKSSGAFYAPDSSKFVRNSFMSFAEGNRQLTEGMKTVDPVGLTDLVQTTVNRDFGKATDLDLVKSYGNFSFNMATTFFGGGTARKITENSVEVAGKTLPRYVYRGLAATDDVAVGIFARSSAASNSPISHVAGKRASQWISTTMSEAVAMEKYGKNGYIRIDLSKVNTTVVDISNGFSNQPFSRFSNWARKDQEVLINGMIPKEAIKVIK